MATKDELIDLNAELTAKVATLEAELADARAMVGGAATEQAPVLIDADGVPLVQDGLYEYDAGLGLIKLDNVKEALSDDPEAVARATAGESDGQDAWLYVEGEGFTRVSDGLVIGLDKWHVVREDGTKAEPQQGKTYRYVGGVQLAEVQPGDESELARKVEELEADRLRAGTTIDELRETNAALTRRVNAGATLHGGIDDLPPVV
jgi:hypothetical protein